MSSLIHVIWDEFELWRKEKVLKMVRLIEAYFDIVKVILPTLTGELERKTFNKFRHKLER